MTDIPFLRKLVVLRSHYFWWIILTATLPLLVMMYLSVKTSKQALENQTMASLSVIANDKVNSIENFIQESKQNTALLARNAAVIEVAKNAAEAAKPGEKKNNAIAMQKLLSYTKHFFEITGSGYTDILLLSPSGKILFTSLNQKLIGENYSKTRYEHTQLPQIFKNVITLLAPEISSFQAQGKTNEAEAYIGVPIFDNQNPIGVLILQMNDQSITKVVNNLSGLGQTGETIVGRIKEDRIVPEVPLRFSSVSEFADKSTNMTTDMFDAFKHAVVGQKGEGLLKDYNQEPVIGVWRYIPSLAWGMLIKINVSEAFAPAIELEKNLQYFAFFVFLLAVGIAYMIAERLYTAEAETKAFSQQLEKSAKELKARNEELDQFAYIASHDLKAPLRSIGQLTQWIEEDFVGTLPAESKQHFELLKNRVQRMNDLVQGILEYSRIGRVHVKLEDVNMKTLLNEVVDALGLPSSFVVTIAPNMPTLTASVVPLSQVFSNLIGNAVKYHHEKQGNIMVTVKEHPNYYEFAVIDDGPGIAKEFHEKVFGLFQTLQARDKFESTGIGLTIVKKIIEIQGGKIWIESELGQGTQFHFTWIKIQHNRREKDGV